MKKKLWLQIFTDGEETQETQPEGTQGESNETEKEDSKNKEEPEKKYSDKDVDAIIDKKFAKWKADQEKAVANAKAEAEKLAKMDAAEKQKYELEKLQKENEELKNAQLRTELGKKASELLKESDIDATQDMLDFVVGKDADETKANIDKFVAIIQKQIQASELKRATGQAPKTYGTSGAPEMTEIQRRIAKYTKK